MRPDECLVVLVKRGDDNNTDLRRAELLVCAAFRPTGLSHHAELHKLPNEAVPLTDTKMDKKWQWQ